MRLAEIVAVTVEVTAVVEIVKVALVAPPGMGTPPGTDATPLFEASATVNPLLGAGPVNVTVPVDCEPPTTLLGETDTEAKVATVIERDAEAEEAPIVAEIDAVAVLATGVVETVKVVVSAPAGTVTDAGTVAAAFVLAKVTTAPVFAGALELSVTVPVDELPPATDVGFSVTLDTPSGTNDVLKA